MFAKNLNYSMHKNIIYGVNIHPTLPQIITISCCVCILSEFYINWNMHVLNDCGVPC